MSRAIALATFVTLALAGAACETTRNFVPDQLPTVTLTNGPVDTTSAPQSWLVDIAWTASDPDGRIDHFEYAIDPPRLKQVRFSLAETTWVTTKENHVVARFRASHPDSMVPGATASEFHVFVLRAVDNRGGMSPNVVRAFYATTVAPDVQITRPAPSRFLSATVPVPFRAEWRGDDPDGDGTHRPASYRTRVIVGYDEASTYLTDPDSLLREGEATGWEEWDTVRGDSSSVIVAPPDVVPGQTALLAVVAVDGAGATTPYLMLDRNLLSFYVVAPEGSYGPRIHFWTALFDFTYANGGYSLDPTREVPIQVGANTPFTLNIDGTAASGRRVVSVRWALDAFDETHWSAPVAPPAVVNVPGLPDGVHRLYAELTDDFGDKSLGIVKIEVFAVPLDHDLLVVNDTRLEVDRFPNLGGDPGPYTEPWPSKSELDTFLFARGGFPWRGTKNPPTGVISSPGLLAGYAFDTLGTRRGLEEARDGVPLSTLARYRHVLWLVDPKGASFAEYLDQNYLPVTALRNMSQPGVPSSLEAYIGVGGQVWLAGGGAAYASLIEFDRGANNLTQVAVFTARDDELGPGRPMYDAAHVRSALGVVRTIAQFERSPAAVGGWAGHGPDGTLSAPDYTNLPAALRYRDPGVDALPPTRLPTQSNLYYPTSSPAEFVLEPDTVSEDFGAPGTPRIESALDTLYAASGTTIPLAHAPAMLYYHGRENAPFVFTGFDLWTWTRSDCQSLVDFVLGDVWKLPKSVAASGASRVQGPRTARPAAARSVRPLDPRIMRP